jgi:DNA invertase Pin-like site-specific DNA recombinase
MSTNGAARPERVAIYARVSTIDQNPNLQLDELTHYAEARRLQVVGQYVDQGVSGAKSQRPQLDALMAAAKRRQFDALLVWKLDRLARSVRHLTTLAGELEALGVDLIVPGQAIDTSMPTGRLLFNMLGAIAEFERDLIRDRVVAGMRAAQRRGKAIGRPQRLRGDQRERIVRLRSSGRSLREIATLLGVSKSTNGPSARRGVAAVSRKGRCAGAGRPT